VKPKFKPLLTYNWKFKDWTRTIYQPTDLFMSGPVGLGAIDMSVDTPEHRKEQLFEIGQRVKDRILEAAREN